MRLTCFGIVLALAASVLTGRANAQIPERTLFQPGSYAYGSYQNAASSSGPMILQRVLVAVPAPQEAEEADDTPQNEWAENFAPPKKEGTILVEQEVPVPMTPDMVEPYLAYHRCPWTGRIHIIPYQKGYAENPDAFPKSQTKLNLWLSSLPCREQNQPQIEYLGYYDPMPTIIEDKPSRLQLILGYPNSKWTSCCDNRWGHRLAQCPGVEPPAIGPYAEPGVMDQECYPTLPGGLLTGLRGFDYGPMGPAPRPGFGSRGRMGSFPQAMPGQQQGEHCPCEYQIVRPQSYYTVAPQPVLAPPCPTKSNCAEASPCDVKVKKPCQCHRCLQKKRAVSPPLKRWSPTKMPACDEGTDEAVKALDAA